jgi:RNA polymerase sigma factor (sigma-70 family)
MTPPPAEELLPRLFLGPALRAQSDRRLVGLVRGGYEAAFDEIMRRYGGPLRRYAGAIVGGRAEDVTQEAFSKALLALRRDGAEIELRPWLYRIVRNTALNDIRDRRPATLALADGIVAQDGVAEQVERREEVAELLERLRALPEAQRAAIVMRELEGLGHDEIASALGVSDGAARQAIHRARTALRNGLGMAVPLPLLRAMLAGSASRSAEMTVGGAGAGVALKAATATVLIAGTFGASVALHEAGQTKAPPETGRREHGLALHSPRSGAGHAVTSSGEERKDEGSRAGGSGRDEGGAQAGQDQTRQVSVEDGNGPRPGSTRGSGPRSGGDGAGHQAGSGDQQPSGHDGGDGGDRGASTSGEGGPSGSSSSSGDGSGDGSGSSSGDGGGSGSTESSESTSTSTSNDGPGSGSGSTLDGSSGSNSGDSGDSSGAEVFSGQTQLQP